MLTFRAKGRKHKLLSSVLIIGFASRLDIWFSIVNCAMNPELVVIRWHVRWLCLDLHCQAVHDWGRVEGPVLLDDQLYSPGSLQNRWIRSLSHPFVVAAGGLRRLGTTVWVNMTIIIHDVQTSFWLCRILWFNYHMVNFITNTSDKRNPNHNLGQTWWFLAIELHDQFRSKQDFRQMNSHRDD
jgi:hypothetical protein